MEDGAKLICHYHFQRIRTHNRGQQYAKKQDQTLPFRLSNQSLPRHQGGPKYQGKGIDGIDGYTLQKKIGFSGIIAGIMGLCFFPGKESAHTDANKN